jgi:hypothetical protein
MDQDQAYFFGGGYGRFRFLAVLLPLTGNALMVASFYFIANSV